MSEKNQISNEPVSFINEQNEIFTMANKDTMTFERALICLNSWILTQDHSDEFVWTENHTRQNTLHSLRSFGRANSARPF